MGGAREPVPCFTQGGLIHKEHHKNGAQTKLYLAMLLAVFVVVHGIALTSGPASPYATCSTTIRSAPVNMGAGFGASPSNKKKKAAPTKKKAKKTAIPAALAIDRAKQAVISNKVADPKLTEGARRAAQATPGATRRVDVDLGRGKVITVVLPPPAEGEVDDDQVAAMSMEAVAAKFGHLTGAGDIVWPAGLAFSRLLAHCPSFVDGKRVLELGAGLGTVGLCAAASGAASVLLSDYDDEVLEYARDGAAVNDVGNVVTTARLDWSVGDLPAGGAFDDPFDVVLGADVLYAEHNALSIARLLPKLLNEGGRCLIADQTQWPWRADFKVACAEGGLVVEEMKLPAPEDVRLLTIFREGDTA